MERSGTKRNEEKKNEESKCSIRRTEWRVKSWTGVKGPGPNTEGKKKLCQEKGIHSRMTQRVRACLAARVQTATSQPRREKVQGSMQRIARIKHRCRHNREIGTDKTLRDGMRRST